VCMWQDLSHTLLRKNILVCLVGRWASEMYFSIPAFHTTMEYFVHRYAAACHDQRVTPEDDQQMQAIYDASLACVQRFKQLMAERPGICHHPTPPVRLPCCGTMAC
jgi:hypothetical protein